MATIASYQAGTFVGISHLWFIKDGFGDKFDTTGKDIVEIPVAEDGGFSYNGGTPSIEHYKVHGIAGDWTSRMTPGDTEINLFIPTIDKEVLEACGFTTTTVSSTDAAKVIVAEKTSGTAQAGDYKFTPGSGTGYSIAETQKAFTVGIAAANDTGTKLFCIKTVKLYASLLFDAADTAKPIGVTLTGASSSSSALDAIGIFEGATSAVTSV